MILGLSFSHNSTACLLDKKNGEIIFCASEERFSRRKNDWGIPYKTLDYIFKNIASKEEITEIIVGEKCESKYGSEEFVDMMYLRNLNFKDAYVKSVFKMCRVVIKEVIGRIVNPQSSYQNIVKRKLKEIGLDSNITFLNHHTSHAASAFFCAPFGESLVVTLDGEGDGLSGSVWGGAKNEMSLIKTLPDVASVGKFYRSITSLLNLKVNRHEGKVTGLAAYGDYKVYYSYFEELLKVVNDKEGDKTIESKIAKKHIESFSLRNINIARMLGNISSYFKSNTWEELLNKIIRKKNLEIHKDFIIGKSVDFNFEKKSNIAATAQYVLEDVVVDFIKYYQEKTKHKNIVLAGGIFANVKLNQRILEKIDFDNIYIHPGMGDEGLALGGAKYFYHNKNNKDIKVLENVYLGAEYDENEIQKALKNFPVEYKKYNNQELYARVAEELVDEKIVGLYRGRFEYGPRALGHRTILINPSKKEINDSVNKRLKRTEFMPFAPVVLEEAYKEIFRGKKLDGARFACRFMTITLDVNKDWIEKIQGVVHVDNTARPQVITEQDDSCYFGILKEFYKKTGIGCVVNTSFNMHEEPIVSSPNDALRSFMEGAIDTLVIENYLVKRKDK